MTALGPNAGTPDSRPLRGTLQAQFRHGPGGLCADLDGFSLHAAVRIQAGRPDRLEHLIRYVARPPIADERLSIRPDGRIAYMFKKRWRDGSAGAVFDPLTFIERLATLITRPRKKLVNYFGVFAPAASWRDRVVPAGWAMRLLAQPRLLPSARYACSHEPAPGTASFRDHVAAGLRMRRDAAEPRHAGAAEGFHEGFRRYAGKATTPLRREPDADRALRACPHHTRRRSHGRQCFVAVARVPGERLDGEGPDTPGADPIAGEGL